MVSTCILDMSLMWPRGLTLTKIQSCKLTRWKRLAFLSAVFVDLCSVPASPLMVNPDNDNNINHSSVRSVTLNPVREQKTWLRTGHTKQYWQIHSKSCRLTVIARVGSVRRDDGECTAVHYVIVKQCVESSFVLANRHWTRVFVTQQHSPSAHRQHLCQTCYS